MAIETARLILRDWREADIAPFIRHTNTPAVMRWLGGVQTEAMLAEIIRGRMMRWQRERGFTFWIVGRKADGALLGFCGIKIADTAGSPIEGLHEVGWRLREDAWGRLCMSGVASLDHAFERWRGARRRHHFHSERAELGPDGAARHDSAARMRL